MPKGRIILPPGSYRLCTTNKPDFYEVGSVITNRRDGSHVQVVYLKEIVEDGDTKYDVWVQPVTVVE